MNHPTALLGDLAEIISGFAFKSEQFNSLGNGLPLVRIRDVVDGSTDTYYSGDYKPEFVVLDGDALIGMDGQFNLSLWRGGRALLNQRVCKVSAVSKRLDQSYLLHFLPAALKEIEDRTPFVTVKHLSVKTLREIAVPLPPLLEQHRIAAILDKADALRAKRREAIAKLDQLLKSVFLEMFGDPVTNSKKWPIQALGQLCDVRDGTHDSPKYVSVGYPLVTSKNLSSGRVSLEGAMLISEEDFEQINKRSKVDRGDLLMPMIGTIGNPVCVDDDPKYAVKNVAILKFGKSEVKSSFVLYLLRSHYFEWVTSKKNRGGTQKFIALGDIRAMQVPFPDQVLLEKFDKFTKAIQIRRNQLEIADRKFNGLFLSMQALAFSGKI